MSARWLVLLPDPVTGLDAPARDIYNRVITYRAPDVTEARRLVKRDMDRNRFGLCAVVSVVDWEARRGERQRKKLLGVPGESAGKANPGQRCWRCGARTPTKLSRYCLAHARRRRKSYTGGVEPPSPDRRGA